MLLGMLAMSSAVAGTANVRAARIAAGAIALDGRLDEAAWRKARPIRLAQQSPKPGMPTPYKTTVRVLIDARHVYFGITNVDPDPAAMAVHTLQRDHSQDDDDHLTIVLDTFGERRLGYFFQVNAGGARNDGLSVNDKTDNNWNGIWNAAVARNAHGWSAEIVIPTQSLQFAAKLRAWGLNVSRYVPRDQLTLRWSGITLNSDVFDLHRAGRLSGMHGLEQGVGLEIQPYALARYNSAPGTGRSGDVGADIKYNFTPQLTGILTVNPDFAEAEAEQGQVNLSRFSLFFPEKRPFFLEGSNLFTFSHLLSIGDDGNLSTRFVPYFSRRIGLVNGQVVPIDEGAKLIGHAGKLSLGVLDVQTGANAVAPTTNLGVARAAYDVNEHLRIGTLMTHGDPKGVRNNSFVGIDSVWHTSHFRGDRNLTVSGWLGHSYGDLKPGRADGYGVAVQYPNDLWSARLKMNVFGDALDPALGYLPRPGTRQYMILGAYQPRPKGGFFDWMRQYHLVGEYIQVDDLDGHPQSKLFMLVPMRFTTEDGNFYNIMLSSRYEALDQPFEVARGVTIPVGRYRFNQVHLNWHSSKSRPFVVSVGATEGRFYSGTTRQASAKMEWAALDGKLQLGLSQENDYGYLPQGNFIIRLTKLNATYSFTPDLALTTFAQYDTVHRKTGVNARLHWVIRPGRELFVVFNHGIEPQLADLDRAPPTGNRFAIKLRWDFQR
ncbi:MAG TPA: DUF5916 domain-containing protein [Oleiagrimonas sp.]|nr:DUF5916 domain-containing protein [Oleiagrimonas sp.]